jgi:proline iminopeptidase
MNRRHFLMGVSALAAAVQTQASSERIDKNADLLLPTDGQVKTGGSRMIDVGGGHCVWTKKVGNAPIKVLLLHGGPGADHCYFECFEDFLPPNGIEMH